MGNFGSIAADGASESIHGANVHPLVRQSLRSVYRNEPSSTGSSSSSAATSHPSATTSAESVMYYPCQAPVYLSWYIEACRAFGGATGLSDDRDTNDPNGTDWFYNECDNVARTIQRTFHKRGQRRFTHHGIFFAVLVNKTEQKQFTAHMKALELIQFLRLPDVLVPETAMVQFLGVRIACIRMAHLHQPVTQLSSGSSSPLSWCSRHASVVKLVIGKVLRLRNDTPLVLYETGDGRLVVVEASTLLPELCLPGSASGLSSTPMRVEYLIGRDLGGMMSCSGLLTVTACPPTYGARDASLVTAPRETYLSLVIGSAAGSKRKGPATPTLHALRTLQVDSSTDLGDVVTVGGVAIANMPVSTFEAHRPAASAENALLTSHMLINVIPALLTVLESLPDDMGAAEFVQLLHLAGVNIHLLAVLYAALKASKLPTLDDAKARVAVEMVSRSGKQWLLQRLEATPSRFEELALELFRGFHEESFFAEQLAPILVDQFGEGYRKLRHGLGEVDARHALLLPTCGDAPFRRVYGRLQELTGVTVAQGVVKSVRPVVRLARRNFTLGLSDESAVCGIAAKRVDGIAGAALFAAASWWANNPSRLAKIVEQLHHRVAAAQQQHQQHPHHQSEGNLVTHLFFTELQFSLGRLVLFRMQRPWFETSEHHDVESDQRQRFEYIFGAIGDFIPSMAALYRDAPHDRLHVARELLPLIDYLLREASTASSGAQALRAIIQTGLLTDVTQYHSIASRNLADALYKLSIEACIMSRQTDEALVVAQRWSKLCPLLFGVESKQNCRASKHLLNALVLSRGSKSEQVAAARTQLRLCEVVFGKRHVKTASALSEYGSLTWKTRPLMGLNYFRRSLELYREILGQSCRPVCSALYNMGLALARLNRFTAALQHLSSAKAMAQSLAEHATARMCEVSENTVYGVATLKIQRWYREQKYGQAQSQTTKTEVTTKCSTLSWSDEHDDIASSAHD